MPNVAILVATLLVLLAPASGRAAFHLANVSEVMSGANGDPAVQFVEIRMNQPFQTVTSHSRLTAFSCNGSSFSVLLEVPSNVPNSGAGLHWIMATTSFAAAAGMTPDFTWDPGTTGNIDPVCGMVCWGAPGIVPPNPPTWDPSDPNNYVDCVGYGGYSGPKKTSTHDSTPTSGTPTGFGPGDGMHSLTRMTTTGDNIADFALACPTPTNNNSVMGSFRACTPPSTTTTTTTVTPVSTTTTTGPTVSLPPATTTTLPCTTARCTIAASETGPACAGEAIPPSIMTTLNQAAGLIDQAATSPAKQARKLLKRAKKALKQAEAKASRAAKGKHAKISSNCAMALKGAAKGVIAGLGVQNPSGARPDHPPVLHR